MARDYSAFPKRICGHKCSRYEKSQICQILAYHGWGLRKSWTKDTLLEYFVSAEKGLTEAQKDLVQRWMSQEPKAPQPFSEFVENANAASVEDDMPLMFRRFQSRNNEGLLAGPTGPSSHKRKRSISKIDASSAAIDCVVCMESLQPESFPKHKITPSCGHETTTCTSCLAQAIESQIPDVPWDQIKCPECPELLDFESVKQVVPRQAFERYDMKSVMATFGHMPNFTMCLGPNCGSGQIHGGGDDQPIMTCTTCKFKTCFTHKLPHHTGQTCEEFDAERKERMEQEAASEKHLKEKTKKCPNPKCGLNCVKISGCDHITCHHCKHQWCYLCFASYVQINQHGNSAHNTTCKYHSTNLPSAPPMVPAAVPRVAMQPPQNDGPRYRVTPPPRTVGRTFGRWSRPSTYRTENELADELTDALADDARRRALEAEIFGPMDRFGGRTLAAPHLASSPSRSDIPEPSTSNSARNTQRAVEIPATRPINTMVRDSSVPRRYGDLFEPLPRTRYSD